MCEESCMHPNCDIRIFSAFDSEGPEIWEPTTDNAFRERT